MRQDLRGAEEAAGVLASGDGRSMRIGGDELLVNVQTGIANGVTPLETVAKLGEPEPLDHVHHSGVRSRPPGHRLRGEGEMADTQVTGAVAALWRFPVKSMLGEVLDEVEVGQTGVLGDRGYALMVADTGKVVSAKHPKVGTALLRCRAEFVDAPKSADDLPPVRITLPSGGCVASDAPDVDMMLSDYLGLRVRLARSAPDDFTIDQYHPDIDDLDPEGHRDEVTESKLGSAFFAAARMASPVPEGAFFDLFPMSVITTSTLNRLGALQPASRFDARRFRMNVVARTEDEGFRENGWIGHSVQLGDHVSLGVALADPRCVMTTLEQGDLPRDTEVLRTLTHHNRLEVVPGARYPCAGVYAVVRSPGMVSVGDAVTVT